MATNSWGLESDQQHSPLLLMRLPVEIRLCIYEIAFKDILTYIESFASSPTSISGVTVKVQGALAFLLASKATRAEFSEGVLPLLAAHCRDFDARVKVLELDWEMKLKMRPHFQPGQIFANRLAAWELKLQRDREVGNARVALQALSTVKHIVGRIAEQSKPRLNLSNDVEDESSKTDA